MSGELTDEWIEGEELAALREVALVRAFERSQGVGQPAECPCGLTRPWSSCCRLREEAALAAFADRSELYELRSAVREFMESTGYGPAIEEHVLEWLRTAMATRDPAEVETFSRMA